MKYLSTAILVLFLALHAAAQRPFSRDHWLNENNTPVKVNALAKDARGYLWLGADAGLYRFNGRNVAAIADTAEGAAVTALATAGDTIYCGYANGHIRLYTDGSFHALQLRGRRPASRINALSWHSGCLWACTDADGIFALVHGDGFQLDSRSGLSDNYAYAIAFSGAGHALVATDRGLNTISMQPGGGLRIAVNGIRSGMPDNITRTIAKAENSAGIAWGGCQDGGIFRLRPGPRPSGGKLSYGSEAVQFAKAGHWTWGQVNDVLPLTDDHAWVATEDGYLVDCRYTDTGFDMMPYYFPGKRFRRILQDNSGSLWCATGEGITLVTDNYISYQSMGSPYTLSGITAMVCDRENNLYYNQDATLYKCPLLHPELVTPILKARASITSLHIDAANRLWIGTLGAGLWYRDGSGIQEFQAAPGLLAGQILDISGIGNAIWVSSLSGVEEIAIEEAGSTTPAAIVHHGKHTGTGSDYIYQLFPDRMGRMWMATDGAGVCMYDGRQFHTWDSSSGLDSKVVYSITEDTAGHIWAASLGRGLYKYDGKTWQRMSKTEGLQDVNITALAANASGQVIIVHGKGMDEWYPGSEQFRHFNRRLGMDIDSQSNSLNCYATDTAGNVWTPFEHGLICFHNLPRQYDLQAGIALNDVLLYLRRVSDQVHEFGAAENHIGFRFDGINFTNPERLFYRYRLVGYDTGWINTNDESVTFPQLPPGKYHFCVQASLNPDFNTDRSGDYDFTIAAPVWKRKWAIALAILLLLAAAYGYQKLRERALRRAAMLQRERMMAEYEQLKTQVNPHFLFNSLNTLASLIEEDSDAAVQYTIQLSDLYRSILTYKDRDLIYLAEEWALLRKYVYVQQSRFGECLHLQVDIPEAVAATKQIVPLALQLLVENAIKHNIVSAIQPLYIYIHASADAITVRNRLHPKISKENGAGLGLANISRRYALMSSRPVQYGIQDKDFIVTLPLL